MMEAGLEKYRKGQEDAAMEAAQPFHVITREMARAIIDAVHKWEDAEGSRAFFGSPTPEEQYRAAVDAHMQRKRA